MERVVTEPLFFAVRTGPASQSECTELHRVSDKRAATVHISSGISMELASQLLQDALNDRMLCELCAEVREPSEAALGAPSDVWLGLIQVTFENLDQIRTFLAMVATRLGLFCTRDSGEVELEFTHPNGTHVRLRARDDGIKNVEEAVRLVAELANLHEGSERKD